MPCSRVGLHPGGGGCQGGGCQGVPGGALSGGGACLLGGGVPARGEGVETRKQTATVADSTHPTGMHSCL